MLVNPRSEFPLAARLRSEEGSEIGEVFSFLSKLYFRGKLTYARAFAPPHGPPPSILVITADRGLVPPETRVTLDDLRQFGHVDIAAGDDRYLSPLTRDMTALSSAIAPDTQVVLITFPPVKAGTSTRLRISETYTDPARYALIDGQLMWHRSFGRPRNDMVLPSNWYLTTSSAPATITQDRDGRLRLSFWNPRADNLDVLVRARRR
jgi:hypothetical protein